MKAFGEVGVDFDTNFPEDAVRRGDSADSDPV
jgi:hypothetical protein